MSAAFVVIAKFSVKSGCMDAFLAAAEKDASTSLSSEPGCRQFDVLRSETTQDAVVFYEVYDSRAAFDIHLATDHVAEFRAAFPALIDFERPVRFLQRH